VRFYSLANAWLFYGHFGKQMAIQRGFPADKLHVVYNALNYSQQVAARRNVTAEDLQKVRQELFAEPELPILVCCSRLQPHRQLHLVIAAMRLLADRGCRVQLLLISDGPERERLESQAREAEVPVHFYGACYDEPTLARLIMAADLTVAPGMVGLTAMQSLAYGTPVLTHDDVDHQAPESESLTPGLTGQLFRYGDVADLAQQIAAWFAARPDRERIRQACEDIIKRFYNPEFQARVIDRVVGGLPADDLFWQREANLYQKAPDSATQNGCPGQPLEAGLPSGSE
jgi:glycosyltransferase involved in cell wall biosynthesis